MFLCQKLAAGDFKANTGEIIHDILGAANKVIGLILNMIIIVVIRIIMFNLFQFTTATIITLIATIKVL